MRYILCAALLCAFVAAQQSVVAPAAHLHREGIFFVNGIDYHFASGTKCTVVVAGHSVINRKFLGIKVRIVNVGSESVTVRPEDVGAEDAVANRSLQEVSGSELAKRMSKPYNWARLAVNTAGGPPDAGSDKDASDPQRSEMLKMMQQMAGQMAGAPVSSSALVVAEEDQASGLAGRFSDEVSHLRRREASGPDVLMQLQRQNPPEFVEQVALLANTIPPRSDLEGVLYYPMRKLERDPAVAKHRPQSHLVRITVPVGEEKFQFLLAVE